MSRARLAVLAVACLVGACAPLLTGGDGGASHETAVERSEPASRYDMAIEAVMDDPLTDLVTDRMRRRGAIGMIDRLVRAVAFVYEHLLTPLLLAAALLAAATALRRGSSW